MNPLYIFLIYIALISVISVIVTISDKSRAKSHKWRVKERTLLILAALGGSVSMYLTMHIIRHKTQKLKFMLGIPVIIVLQVIAVYLVFRYVG